MREKKIAFFLCLILFLNAFLPTISYADSVSSAIQHLDAYKGDVFEEGILLNSSITIKQIEEYLDDKYAPTTRDGKYFLNPYVFQKYKVVAYTNQEAIDNKIAGLSSKGTPKKETQIKDGTGKRISIDEYRYLGYKLNGSTIITNDFFPADSKTISDPTKRKYIFTDPKKKSYGDSIFKIS